MGCPFKGMAPAFRDDTSRVGDSTPESLAALGGPGPIDGRGVSREPGSSQPRFVGILGWSGAFVDRWDAAQPDN